MREHMDARSRHPHEIMILISSLALGIVGTVSYERIAGTIVSQFPGYSGRILITAVGVGSLIGLAGVFTKGVLSSLLERLGLIILGTFLGIYSSGAIIFFGWRGLGFAVFLGGIAVASIWRAVQIPGEIRQHAAIMRLLEGQVSDRD